MKKIKMFLILLSIIIFVCILGVCISYINKKTNITFKSNIKIKVGDKLPTIKKLVEKENYNKVKDINIKWKNIVLDNNKVYNYGNYIGTFTYKEKKYEVKLIVLDDKKPIIDNVKDISIYVNDKVDFYKDIKISDNSKDELKKDIVGEYDFNKKGEYELKYVVTDKANNTTEESFKLIVKEKPVQNITNNSNIKTNNNSNLTGTSSKGYKITYNNGAYYVNGILVANKTYSLSSSYNPGGLNQTFMNNYNKMVNDAKSQGINLRIISGFRSYQKQQSLYNNYVARDGKAAADRYSARAGHSEHQTGLAADINSLEQSWENTKEGKWLNDKCYKYGFIIRFPKGKESITGYMFEPWHIRYVGVDIATTIYNNGNWSTLEEYLGIDSKYY